MITLRYKHFKLQEERAKSKGTLVTILYAVLDNQQSSDISSTGIRAFARKIISFTDFTLFENYEYIGMSGELPLVKEKTTQNDKGNPFKEFYDAQY